MIQALMEESPLYESVMPKELKLNGSKRPTRPSRTPKKDILFIIGYWNAKVGSQDTWSNWQVWPWSTEWSRGMPNRDFQREHTGHSKHTLPTTQEMISTHRYHQMVNTEIRLVIFFAFKDGEALYSQQKQDWELTVAQIMNSLLQNSDLNWGLFYHCLLYNVTNFHPQFFRNSIYQI